METFKLIPAKNKEEWINALKCCGVFDTYHLPEYHLLAMEQAEGDPYLFFFQYNDQFAAIPFLLRPISELDGLEGYQYMDATSVYGYPGIVTSLKECDRGIDYFLSHFQDALLRSFRQLRVVTFFSRLSPLIPTDWLFRGIAEVKLLSMTVAIDLTNSEEDQLKGMTKGHRYDIRKAKGMGINAWLDKSFEHIEDFVEMYKKTMTRTDALDYYHFQNEYFIKLKEYLGNSLKLFVAEKDGVIISASLFLVTGNIVQYHLSGTPTEYLKLSGAKIIIDEVRKWATADGYSWLHLGGGFGSKEDSLFRFKAGFSKLRFPFKIVRLILEPTIYTELVRKRIEWESKNGFNSLMEDYFPEYRKPIQKK